MMGFPAVYRFIPFGCTDNERTAAEKGYKTARLEVMTSNSARLYQGGFDQNEEGRYVIDFSLLLFTF